MKIQKLILIKKIEKNIFYFRYTKDKTLSRINEKNYIFSQSKTI